MNEESEIVVDPLEEALRKSLARKARRAKAKAARKLRKELREKENCKQMVRNELDRENKFTEATFERWENNWKQMLINFKQIELGKEVESSIGKIKSMLDNKQNLIERLQNDIRTVNEYMRFESEGHMKIIKFFKKTFEILMKSIKDLYEDETFNIIQVYREDYNYHKSVEMCSRRLFESIYLGSNDLFAYNIDQEHMMFGELNEEGSNSFVTKQDQLRDATVLRMNKLYRQMRRFVSKIRSTAMTPERVKKYKKFVAVNNHDEERLQKIADVLAKQYAIESDLMQQRNKLEIETMTHMKTLHQEKQFFMQCFLTMRKAVDAELERDEKFKRSLSYGAYLSIEKLKGYQVHGEHLMSMLAVCSKLETEREKVLPFSAYTSETVASLQCSSYPSLLKMDFFWVRVNNVVKHIKELEEEKRALTEENAKLQKLIKQYCQQDKYARTIAALQLCSHKTAIVVRQEASHMVTSKQINAHSKYS